jgi:hypothetical protein
VCRLCPALVPAEGGHDRWHWVPPTGRRAPAHRAFRRHRARLSHRLERRRCSRCSRETAVCDRLRRGSAILAEAALCAQGRWWRLPPRRLSAQRPMDFDVRVADVHTRAEPARRGRLPARAACSPGEPRPHPPRRRRHPGHHRSSRRAHHRRGHHRGQQRRAGHRAHHRTRGVDRHNLRRAHRRHTVRQRDWKPRPTVNGGSSQRRLVGSPPRAAGMRRASAAGTRCRPVRAR